MRNYKLYLKDIMAAMRDRLIHFYFGVNYRLVWKTIKEDIPKAKSQIQRILGEKQ